MASISTLGQQLNLVARMKDIQANMSKYQQQVTTGVKHNSFADYGVDSLKIQRYRASLKELEAYSYNIANAQVNISQMNQAIDENMKQAQNILAAIGLQLPKGEEFSMETIRQAANTALQVIESNVNTEIGGRYLFSGSDVTNKPYTGGSGATNNIAQQVSNWLDGTVDTDTFISGLDGMTDTEMGFSTTVQTAKKIYARADDSYEVDYTVKANNDGFKKVINGLRALTQMEYPEGTDVANKDNFYAVINHVYASIKSGIDDMRAEASKLGTASSALEVMTTNHQNDTQSLQVVLENTEAADTTDAIIRFQTLQTQLEASYNITSIVSQLSLARFLN
jgi:flagellar hook-associated protein 3 FlgL